MRRGWCFCRVSRLLSSLCIRSSGAGHASDRAELLRFLLDKGYNLDLASVNARLETPLHCALRSRSLEILEVRSHSLHYLTLQMPHLLVYLWLGKG